jgi:hypothetical protein
MATSRVRKGRRAVEDGPRETDVADDLPKEKRQHVDEQTALANPGGPGGSKKENLRRIERQVEEQRRRRHAAAGHRDEESPDR